MNPNKIKRLFPHASESFLEANSHRATELPANNEKPSEGHSLVSPVPGKTKSSYRFKIVFRVYAVRPADWDGYHIKELQDLLVESGYLPSDDWSTLKGEVDPQKVDRKEEEKTVITIERI